MYFRLTDFKEKLGNIFIEEKIEYEKDFDIENENENESENGIEKEKEKENEKESEKNIEENKLKIKNFFVFYDFDLAVDCPLLLA